MEMAIDAGPYPGFLPDIPPSGTGVPAQDSPQERRPDGWTDAELRTLATDLDLPLEASGVDRSGTPGVRWRRAVCWLKGHYPVEVWSKERHHHTECGRCPRRWSPDDAPLAVESQII